MTTSTTFLHLSDLHLVAPGQLVAGVDPMRQMQGVLTRITQLDVTPAFIVVSGDLSENGSAESYEVVNEVLKELGGEELRCCSPSGTTTIGQRFTASSWERRAPVIRGHIATVSSSTGYG